MTHEQSLATQPGAFAQSPSRTASERRRAVRAGIIGNTLEWYDFGVYGFLATVLAKQFFPESGQYIGLLQTFGAFGVGFLARPLGSILLGRMGDIVGRKAVLTLTILMMAIGTIAIGVVPTYERIGIAAPLVLLIARVLQGLAAGGEWGNAAAFLAEWAKPGRRGFYGGLLLASVSGGLLLGSGVAACVSTLLSPEQMTDWGWRIPFLLGAALIPVGLYMRRNVQEPPKFRAQASAGEVPQHQTAFPALLLRAACICLPLLMASYMVTVYMPSYAQLYGSIPRSMALWANTCALALTVVGAPIVGLMSDLYGRRRQMLICAVLLIVMAYPMYWLIASGVSFSAFFAIQMLLTAVVVGFNGAVPATVTELFPTSTRAVGAALANAIAGVFGGFTPFISTWLIKASGSVASPAWLVVFCAVAALLALVGMKEMAHRELT
jgi:MHS family proline/betaine transporter-like MFS transporter